jgi:arylformamidase
MKRYYDISLTITPRLPVWPGDPTVILERFSKIENGANSNSSRISMSVHTGTHLDAPFHFIKGGRGVDELALEVLIGSARVLQLPDDCDLITADVLQSQNVGSEPIRWLFKTRNSHYWTLNAPIFHKDYVGISSDGAEYLVNHGVKLVGVDYLSVSPFRQTKATHQILLSAGVIALEGLDLSEVPPGDYELIALPVKLGGCDGAPVRAVLIAG